MLALSTVATLSDAALLEHVMGLVARERQTTAELVASLGELDARRLYLGAGCSSLFTYCTQILHLSEHAAYARIEAARCARRFPEILDRLADGSLTLTAVCVLAPVMTFRNGHTLLNRARYKSRREVEHIVAELRPKPDVVTVIRKTRSPAGITESPDAPSLAQPANAQSEEAASIALTPPPAPVPASAATPMAQLPPQPGHVRPLGVETYKVQFTMSRRGYENLRRAQDLLRHTIPNGDPAAVFERALSVLVENLERRKIASTPRPRAAKATTGKQNTRHIAASTKRAVWQRDGGRCAFVGTKGRCRERGRLEFHHVIPFADGGETSVDNLQLRCRAHNQHEATLWSGVDSDQLGSDRVGTKSAPRTRTASVRGGRQPP